MLESEERIRRACKDWSLEKCKSEAVTAYADMEFASERGEELLNALEISIQDSDRNRLKNDKEMSDVLKACGDPDGVVFRGKQVGTVVADETEFEGGTHVPIYEDYYDPTFVAFCRVVAVIKDKDEVVKLIARLLGVGWCIPAGRYPAAYHITNYDRLFPK